IAIEPRELQGRVTLGGVNLGAGALLLRHNEFHWSAAIPIAPDGSFRAPLWQDGKYSYTIQTPSLPTPFSALMELDGAPVEIEIPDGRITGTVRDAATGAPLAGATVALQTNTGTAEQHVRTATDAAGKFDFVGMKYARHTVRISLPAYLDPQPLRFELDGDNRLRTFDVALDRGRTVPLLVIDANDDPVDEATVYAMAGGRVCARVTTDEDGRTEIAVPQRGDATLFVIPPDGAFAVARVAREHSGGRMRVYLPRAASSLSIRAQTTAGADMPPFSLLMRYNGVLVPLEVSEELSVTLGHRLTTGRTSEVELDRIPSGSYEFWPYRTEDEATAIVESGDGFTAPIQVNVRTGENKIAVKFTTR
ncbi:MAG TPA: carboxypeptidase regulatory-like domain-containing protein, partial [Thermoanaerobaculia bacterium]|nr:carboxypeptidase regulatory-like domain-containing protein [Thermoanaerobaculia bacterium]